MSITVSKFTSHVVVGPISTSINASKVIGHAVLGPLPPSGDLPSLFKNRGSLRHVFGIQHTNDLSKQETALKKIHFKRW